MKYKKGKSGNPKGRPKGSVDKKSAEFKQALNDMLRESSPKIQKWIDRIARNDPARALDHICRLAEYVYPKLSRQEMVGDKSTPLQVTLTTLFAEIDGTTTGLPRSKG